MFHLQKILNPTSRKSISSFAILLFILCHVPAKVLHAQHLKKLQITVLDVDTSEALQDVTVRVIPIDKIVATDKKGTTQIDLPSGEYILMFSFVGYESITRKVIVQEGTPDRILVKMKFSTSLLESVSVRALREEDSVARKVKENVMPVTVLTAKQIENRASNLNELLARQTGVQIRRTGGVGSAARISVRGLEGKRVQIFIDGNPLNTPDGSLGINDLPLQIIERIEIYKGTVPAWLGGDGLGSAVNVIIRHRDVSYIDATASYQTYNTISSGIILKKTFEKKGIEAGAGVFTNSSDNDFMMELPDQPGVKVKRDHDKFKSLLAGVALRFSKLWFDEVELEGAYIKMDKELQGIQRNIQHVRSIGDTRVAVIGLEKSHLLDNKLSFRFHGVLARINVKLIDTASYNYDWEGNRSPSIFGKGEMGNGPNLSINLQNEWRQQANINYALSKVFTLNLNNTLRVGKFDPNDDVGNEFAGKNIYNYPGELFNSTTGLTLETRVGDKFLFSTALKHYFNKVEGYNTNIYLQEPPDLVHNVTNKFGYNAGVRYNLTPALMIKASHERAVRLPVNAELFGDGVLITPAIFLVPEVAYNNTFGIIYDKVLSSDRRLQAEANAFYMQVDNLIQLRGNGLSIGYGNFGKATIYGADAEIKYEFTHDLFASFNLTWQRLTDANRFLPASNVPNPTYELTIPNTPLLFSNWSLEYSRHKTLGSRSKTKIIYDGSYTAEYNYGFELSVYDEFIIPSFLTHTLSIEQSFQNSRYTITAEANNLTDETVINNFNQPLPGRTFRIKVRYLLLGNEKLEHNH